MDESLLISSTRLESTTAPALTVESIDNHVYFYSDVNSDRCLALLKNIREIDNKLRTERYTRSLPDDVKSTPIWLHILSDGGYIFPAFSLADQLNMIKTPIYSIVEGICASAATIISMSVTKRFITKSGFMLVHQLSGWSYGTYEQLKDDMHLNDLLMEKILKFYSNHSKFSKKELRKRLKHDSWFNAEQCLKYGLVDEYLK